MCVCNKCRVLCGGIRCSCVCVSGKADINVMDRCYRNDKAGCCVCV